MLRALYRASDSEGEAHTKREAGDVGAEPAAVYPSLSAVAPILFCRSDAD